MLIKTAVLRCDVCGKRFGEDKKFRTGTLQRTIARKEGWVYSGNKDYCDNCRAKKLDGTNHKSIKKNESYV